MEVKKEKGFEVAASEALKNTNYAKTILANAASIASENFRFFYGCSGVVRAGAIAFFCWPLG